MSEFAKSLVEFTRQSKCSANWYRAVMEFLVTEIESRGIE